MWRCVNCGEESEDSFDACWSCGTAADGTPNPYFHREMPEEGASGASNQASSSSPFTHAELGVLACRCIALWLFLGSIEGLVGFVLSLMLLARYSMVDTSAAYTGIPLVRLIISVVLWIKSDRIGRRLVLRPNAALHILRSNMRSVLPVALVVIGILLATRQISYFARLVVYLIEFRAEFLEVWWSGAFQQEFWPVVVSFALGLWLAFDARRIARKITGRRQLRVSQEEDAAAA